MSEIKLRHTGSKVLADIVILPPEVYRRALSASEPAPVESFVALIDTGAEATCLSRRFVNSTGFQTIGKRRVRGVSGIAEHYEYYFHVGFFTRDGPVEFYPKPIRGIDFESGGDAYDLLLGMDVISSGDLHIRNDGTARFAF